MVKLQPPPLNWPKEDGLNLISGFKIARKRPKNYVFSLEKLTFRLNTYGFGVRLAERPDKKVRNLDRYNRSPSINIIRSCPAYGGLLAGF
jgi:hypothetical protein